MSQFDFEIKEADELLDGCGHLKKAGWARQLLLRYDRSAIKAGALRIKEWDYYLITGLDYALALTVDDNSYMSLDSISLLDFRGGIDSAWEVTTSPMGVMTLGKRNFPKTSAIGDVEGKGKHHCLTFRNPGPDANGETKRNLSFNMKSFAKGKVDSNGRFTPDKSGKMFGIRGNVTLTQPAGDDTIVMATPYKEKATAFYYNQKIDCQPAEGYAELYCGNETIRYEFKPEDSFGCLDWGRGVWTYKNTWYWGSASSMLDGKRFGFNIGYGFGDNPASENMVFYDGKGHKLNNLSFNIPQIEDVFVTRGSCCGTQSGDKINTGEMHDDFMKPWTFTSDDGRFEMDFVPVLDRAADTDVKIIRSNQHQVFGYYTGDVVLDDGTKVHIDHMLGFAEKVFNKW